jgi:hypothetical protein
MTDIEDQMDETASRAEALGVSGDQPEDSSESSLDTDDNSSDSPTSVDTNASTSETSETSETLEISDSDGVDKGVGGVTESQYPNPDKDLGSLIDTYENFNVYVPPEVKGEINSLYKRTDLDFSQTHGEDLDTLWDFYTAVFRAVLRNPEIVREELGLDDQD